jgi:hypothetical protein
MTDRTLVRFRGGYTSIDKLVLWLGDVRKMIIIQVLLIEDVGHRKSRKRRARKEKAVATVKSTTKTENLNWLKTKPSRGEAVGQEGGAPWETNKYSPALSVGDGWGSVRPSEKNLTGVIDFFSGCRSYRLASSLTAFMSQTSESPHKVDPVRSARIRMEIQVLSGVHRRVLKVAVRHLWRAHGLHRIQRMSSFNVCLPFHVALFD